MCVYHTLSLISISNRNHHIRVTCTPFPDISDFLFYAFCPSQMAFRLAFVDSKFWLKLELATHAHTPHWSCRLNSDTFVWYVAEQCTFTAYTSTLVCVCVCVRECVTITSIYRRPSEYEIPSNRTAKKWIFVAFNLRPSFFCSVCPTPQTVQARAYSVRSRLNVNFRPHTV